MREMKCRRCGANENRIHGFCSMECETAWEYEDDIRDLTARIAELEAEIDIRKDQLREAKNILIDKNLQIGSLYEGGYKLQKRIAELEAESERFTVHSDIEWQDAEERAHLEKLVSSLKARIAGLEAANDALLKDNDMLFRASVAGKSPNDTQTQKFVYGKEGEE